jgi:hypothetical protein
MTVDIDLYTISDIEERIFFIKNVEDRLNVRLICDFAVTKECNTFGELKDVIHQIEYPNIIEKIHNRYFDETLTYIWGRKLWSREVQD